MDGTFFFLLVGLFFLVPLLLVNVACSSCILSGEPAELCHSGREGAACQRWDQAGAFLACDQSLSQM